VSKIGEGKKLREHEIVPGNGQWIMEGIGDGGLMEGFMVGDKFFLWVILTIEKYVGFFS
jgi:hypothetical protein